MCVYDIRDGPPGAASVVAQHPVKHEPQRLELPALPPPYLLPWQVELCSNTLPAQTCSAPAAPFHADPRERLITVRATNSTMHGESTQHVFHLSARATLSQYFAARRDDNGTVPWRAWCAAVHITKDRTLPLAIKSSLLTCGTWAVSNPPDGRKGVLDVGCYLPQGERMHQSVKVPPELVPDEGGFLDVPWEGGFRRVRCVPGVLSVLCEDGIIFFTVCLIVSPAVSIFGVDDPHSLDWRRPDRGSCAHFGIPSEHGAPIRGPPSSLQQARMEPRTETCSSRGPSSDA